MPWLSCHVAMDPMTWYCSIDTFGKLQVGGAFFFREKGWHPFFQKISNISIFSHLSLEDGWLMVSMLRIFFEAQHSNRWTWSRKFSKSCFLNLILISILERPLFFDNWKPFNGASLNHTLFRSQHLWKPGTCGSHPWCCWQQQPFLQGHWVYGVLW